MDGGSPISIMSFCKKYNVRLGRNDVSQYLSGKSEPGQKKISILSKGLNVDEAWLMGYDVPMNDEERVLIEQAELYSEQEPLRVYNIAGYVAYKLVQTYNSLPLEGKEEMNVLLNYLISKYGISEQIMSEDAVTESIYGTPNE